MVLNPSAVKKFFVPFLLGVVLALGSISAWSAPYSQRELSAVESSQEKQIRELREQEIKQVRLALSRRLPANRMADLYYRLAELYLEAYRAAFMLEGRAHEERLKKKASDRFIDRTYSKPFLRQGLDAAQDIVQLKIPYDKKDAVYYFLGFYHSELGNTKQSLYYYKELTAKYPRSPFAGEGYRELGESYYLSKKYRDAQAYFEQALKFGVQKGLSKVNHRLAWCYYRTRQYDRAIQTMKTAIEQAGREEEKLVSIREEALRDMAIFMTERGQVSEAISYFNSVAGSSDYYPKALERLGGEYERSAQPDKAAAVYQSLLKVKGGDESSFRVLVRLVDLQLRIKKYDEAYQLVQGASIPFGASDDEITTSVRNLKAMTRRTATENHERYRKKKDKKSLQVAESFYILYLQKFLTESQFKQEIPEIKMYLAEAKREQGEHQAASKLYREVLELKDPRYSKEAGALWVGTLSSAIKSQAKTGAPKSEPSELEKEFVSASDELERNMPGTFEAREAAVKSAQLLAGYSSTVSQATERAQALAEKYPSTSQGLIAARLWLQIHSDRVKDPKKMETSEFKSALRDLQNTIEELSANQALMAEDKKSGKGQLAKMIAEQTNKMSVAMISLSEKEGDFEATGESYEKYANAQKDSALAQKAYENAAFAFDQIPSPEDVYRVMSAWLERYPNSTQAEKVTKGFATRYLISGLYQYSAQMFEKVGVESKDADSLLIAASVFEGIGDWQKAEINQKRFVNLYVRDARRGDILLQLALSQVQRGKKADAAQSFQACIKADAELAPECGARLGDLYLNQNDEKSALQLYTQVARMKKGRQGYSPFVGYARYKLVELREQKTRFAPLKLPEAELKKGLEQRLKFFETLSRVYQNVVDAGGAWGVAALNRLAQWAVQFADDVDQIAPPVGLSEQARANFKGSLQNVSSPLRKKAGEIWFQAYQNAVRAELFSEHIVEVVDQLADLKAPLPKRAQGPRAQLELAGAQNMPADQIRKKLGSNENDSTAWVEYGNFLWKEGKPVLASVAYDRALIAKKNNAQALNNKAVILLERYGIEDWYTASYAKHFFEKAIQNDPGFTVAQQNQALLFNYYRLYQPAKLLWDQILKKSSQSVAAWSGLGVAQVGLGFEQQAQKAFESAKRLGLDDESFVYLYHQASIHSTKGKDGADDCVDELDDIDLKNTAGFERLSVDKLKRTCELWKK